MRRIVFLACAVCAWAACVHAQTNPAAGPVIRIEPAIFPAPGALAVGAGVRLQAERAVMAQELRALGGWNSPVMDRFKEHREMDPGQIEKIVARMNEGARDTVQDNQERFARAFGERFPPFAKAYAIYRDGKFEEAAAE